MPALACFPPSTTSSCPPRSRTPATPLAAKSWGSWSGVTSWTTSTRARPSASRCLLGADYSGANFTFAIAEASDGLAADDPLIGHTFLLAGTATRGEERAEFVAYVDQDEDRSIIGLPLSFMATQSSTEQLALRFDAVDPVEGDTILADIDIVSLDEDGDGFVEISVDENPEAWANLRRDLQVHDHYAVEVIE